MALDTSLDFTGSGLRFLICIDRVETHCFETEFFNLKIQFFVIRQLATIDQFPGARIATESLKNVSIRYFS